MPGEKNRNLDRGQPWEAEPKRKDEVIYEEPVHKV